MRLLILGGNRFIGAELVEQAIKQGHDVTVLSLDKPSTVHARWLEANRESPLTQTLSRLVFDVVIDNIAFRGEHVTSLIAALKGRVQRYVLTSSVDIYGNDQAKYCDELKDEKLEPNLHSDKMLPGEGYVRGKRACEIALRSSAHVEKVIVRPAVVMGARDNFMCPKAGSMSRSQFFPFRISDGGPILLRHTDTRLHQTAFVGDVARALLLAATHPSAPEQVLNVVGDEVWTNESLVHLLSRSVGRPVDVVRVTNSQLASADLAEYETPYFSSSRNLWSLFSNNRLKSLGWVPTAAEEWGKSLFRFRRKFEDSILEQRQKEIRLSHKILDRTSINMHGRVKGSFHRNLKGVSSVGIGTYSGSASTNDDDAYLAAIKQAVLGNINVIDTAINYRSMRSEQTVGRAIRRLVMEGTRRSSLCVVTKGGFIPSHLSHCGVLTKAEIERRHSISPQYIEISLQQSLVNMGLECIDIYLLHNPEASLESLGEGSFYQTLIKTFAMLEHKVRAGAISAYGIATWDGLRVKAGHKRYIDLERVTKCAEIASGGRSSFGVIELPFNYLLREAATVSPTTSMIARCLR